MSEPRVSISSLAERLATHCDTLQEARYEAEQVAAGVSDLLQPAQDEADLLAEYAAELAGLEDFLPPNEEEDTE